MIRFFTFSQFHNKVPPAGSTHIRVTQLLKYWKEAGLYKYGENPEVLIFQKVYMAQDYQFPKNFEGIKILDICDPDWIGGMSGIKATVDAMSAVTCSSKKLAEFMRQMTDKPVIHIPDRFDMTPIPKPKRHMSEAKSVVWYGYRHNAETLKYAMPLINELGLDLLIIAEDDPMAWQWLPGEVGDEFKAKHYRFMKYREETIYQDLQRADFAVLPYGDRPVDKFKSNNKTVKAILAGLPVAHDSDQVKGFMHPGVRRDYLEAHYTTTIKEYDVKRSVDQFKELIATLKESKA